MLIITDEFRAGNRSINTFDFYKVDENGHSCLMEQAFNRGVRDFEMGARVPAKDLSRWQKIWLFRRSTAIKKGDRFNTNKYTNLLLDEHLILQDEYENEVYSDTTPMKVVDASNPFRKGSVWAKEWQRGNDTAYFRQLDKNQRNKI